MPFIWGQAEHRRWKKGERLSRSEAILAMCYDCNGFEEGGEDCDAGDGYDNCPLYAFMSYGKEVKYVEKVKKKRSEKQLAHDKKLRKIMKERKRNEIK